MSIGKIKKFARDHKEEIITFTVVVGGAALVVLGFKICGKKKAPAPKVKDIPIPESLKAWNATAIWEQGEYMNAIIESIPIDDLGELGKKYIKEGFAKPGDIASIIIGTDINK